MSRLLQEIHLDASTTDLNDAISDVNQVHTMPKKNHAKPIENGRTFDALTLALEDWFDVGLAGLPDALRKRVEEEILPMPWDGLAADQRRSVVLQLDYQHDPATEQDQQHWMEFFERMRTIQGQIDEWRTVAAPTAGELDTKERRLRELGQELTKMEAQSRQARGDYFPLRKSREKRADPYIAYPRAMHQLQQRVGATPEELAAWIWVAPELGGIAAYVNANELDPPPRFRFGDRGDSQDYLSPLMACWFLTDDVAKFAPAERFITGSALIERWKSLPVLQAEAFIVAKIRESRLQDLHPLFGGTVGTFDDQPSLPPLTSGLFSLSEIKKIEAEDFGEELDSPSPADKNSQFAETDAGATRLVVDGNDEAISPRRSTVRREARKLTTQAMYATWQKAYRVSKKKYPNKSDVWYSLQIAKLSIAHGRDADTIRKHMHK